MTDLGVGRRGRCGSASIGELDFSIVVPFTAGLSVINVLDGEPCFALVLLSGCEKVQCGICGLIYDCILVKA